MLEGGCNKEDCVYRSTNHDRFITCDFILWTHERRGCPIGDKCTRYIPGERTYNWMSSFSFYSPPKE